MGPQLREPVRVEFRSDRQWCLDLVGKPVHPRNPKQVGAIDIQDIERQGNPRDPLRLRDELLGKGSGRDHVEDLDRIEGHGALTAEVSGREHAVGLRRAGLSRSLSHCLDQRLAALEPAIEGGS